MCGRRPSSALRPPRAPSSPTPGTTRFTTSLGRRYDMSGTDVHSAGTDVRYGGTKCSVLFRTRCAVLTGAVE
eukprot:2118671-Rhodomonas_salina.1